MSAYRNVAGVKTCHYATTSVVYGTTFRPTFLTTMEWRHLNRIEMTANKRIQSTRYATTPLSIIVYQCLECPIVPSLLEIIKLVNEK